MRPEPLSQHPVPLGLGTSMMFRAIVYSNEENPGVSGRSLWEGSSGLSFTHLFSHSFREDWSISVWTKAGD